MMVTNFLINFCGISCFLDLTFFFFVNFLFLLLIDVAIARLNDEKEKVGLMKMEDLKKNCDNKKNWMSSAQLWTNQTKTVILIFF